VWALDLKPVHGRFRLFHKLSPSALRPRMRRSCDLAQNVFQSIIPIHNSGAGHRDAYHTYYRNKQDSRYYSRLLGWRREQRVCTNRVAECRGYRVQLPHRVTTWGMRIGISTTGFVSLEVTATQYLQPPLRSCNWTILYKPAVFTL